MGSAGRASDESSIEATIRRVAEARAAAESDADDDSSAPEFVAISDEADAANQERRVDALVQRVAAAKAARVTGTPEDPIEATIRRVAETPEDAIEATIRRVAEAKAAREAAAANGDTLGSDALSVDTTSADAALSSTAEDADPALADVAATQPVDERHEPTPDDALEPSVPTSLEDPSEPSGVSAVNDEDAIEATIRRVAEAKAAREAAGAELHSDEGQMGASDTAADRAAPEFPEGRIISPPAWREPLRAAPASGDHDDNLRRAVTELRRDLDETRRALASLTARFDALQTALGGADEAAQAPSASGDEDWDDTPSLPRIPLGQQPQPPIFRDPPPSSVVAAQAPGASEELVIDTRPIPKPLPPLHAEPRRGLDLLPRSYRVTVEDKRRGVDLVPLHRALLGMDGVRDMSLLSYSNGVAIVSLDTVDQLDPEALCNAISRAMARPARVEVHNEQTMVVKLAEE